MIHQENIPEHTIQFIEDLTITYDMKKLLADAKLEFDGVNSNKELLGQEAIGTFFNLNKNSNARN